MTDPKPRSQVDWEKVELDYRAGLKSLREIGSEHGVSNVGVLKRAKREGWERDLSAKIKAKADALVSREAVSAEVSALTTDVERAVVDANATAIMRVRLTHRKDIARARAQAMKLLEELEQAVEAGPLLQRLAELVAEGASMDPTTLAKQQAQIEKSLELSTRTGVMKALADTMTKLIALEREAYSLESDKSAEGADEGFEAFRALMGRIDGAGTGLS